MIFVAELRDQLKEALSDLIQSLQDPSSKVRKAGAYALAYVTLAQYRELVVTQRSIGTDSLDKAELSVVMEKAKRQIFQMLKTEDGDVRATGAIVVTKLAEQCNCSFVESCS